MRPLVDLTHSPFALLRPAAIDAVTLHDHFWAPILRRNAEVSIPSQWTQLDTTGRLKAFRTAHLDDFSPPERFANDSDVYKWIEAASYALAGRRNSELEARVDDAIADVAGAQEADGYVHTCYTGPRAGLRWSDLKDMHELYTFGHLIQAAVAHHRCSRKATFLKVACGVAECIYARFGPQGRRGACGHPELEMALVELYRETADVRWLELAERMVEARGQEPRLFGGSAYYQDHAPFTAQRDITGHAVRHLYLACGAADIAAETGNTAYRRTLNALWQSFTARRMYVTGGAGSRYEGEAFGADWELPNDRAYTETCAAIGAIMFGWRMLHLTGEAQYADVIERCLYNGMLSGVSLDGLSYFYQNPLADRGAHRRSAWFGCACCPPNIARTLAALPGLFYSTGPDGVWCHLYATSAADLRTTSGEPLRIVQQTRYPWDGDIELLIEEAPLAPFTLRLRVPGWADAAHVSIEVNGEVEPRQAAGYAAISRAWQAGDVVRLRIPMEVAVVHSSPDVIGNWGRGALQRGPIVYCFEQADNPSAPLFRTAITRQGPFETAPIPELGEGVLALRMPARAIEASEALYTAAAPRTGDRVEAAAVPYYAWANRAPGAMQVWMPLCGEGLEGC